MKCAHIFSNSLCNCAWVELYYFFPTLNLVLGDSAGGNLAAVVSQHLRNHPLKPKLQVLVYPNLQAVDLETPSYQQHGHSDLILYKYDVMLCIQYYALGELDKDIEGMLNNNTHIAKATRLKYAETYLNVNLLPRKNLQSDYTKSDIVETEDSKQRLKLEDVVVQEKFSPLLAENISGLPTTFVYIAQYDMLRDDGHFYVKRLRANNIPVEQYVHKPAFHGMLFYFTDFKEGKECFDKIVEFILTNI